MSNNSDDLDLYELPPLEQFKNADKEEQSFHFFQAMRINLMVSKRSEKKIEDLTNEIRGNGGKEGLITTVKIHTERIETIKKNITSLWNRYNAGIGIFIGFLISMFTWIPKVFDFFINHKKAGQ